MTNSQRDREHHSGEVSPAQGAKPNITLTFVLAVLRRWWKVTVPVGLLLAAAAATGVYLTFVPKYEARALLWIDSAQPYLVQPERYSDRDFVSNQLGLIRSSLVLGPVVSQPAIARVAELQKTELFGKRDPPIERLGKLIDVSKAWGSEHYYIKCTTPNPKNSAAVVDAVAKSYFDLVDEYEAGRTRRLIELLEREREASEREVERLRENVRQVAIEQTGKDPFAARADQDGALVLPLADLESQITGVRVEQAVLNAQITALEEYLEKNPINVTDEMIDRMVEQDAEFQRRKAVIAEKQARLEDIKSKAPQGAKAPLYVSRESEVQREEKTLAELRPQLCDRARDELNTSLARQRNEKLAELKARQNEFAVRDRALTSAHEAELKKVKQFTGETLDLEMKRAELARADQVLDRIAQRAFLLRTEQRAPSRVELLEKATVPLYPVEPLPYKQLVVASFGAFLLPFALFFLWDLRLCRLGTAEQVGEIGHLRVIGEIATFASIGYGRGSKAGRINRQLRPFEESIEGLRTFLLLSQPVEGMQVVAITSAGSREGKTTVAAQLAISIARSTNEPTLLVDGDMRAPDIHEIFDIENEAGLFDVLDGQRGLEEVVATSWHERLHLLPAGKLRGIPHKPFGNGAMKSMLGDARKVYRHIVIDTPPLLAASEALVMAAAADATIMCVMRDRTRRDQADRAGDRLAAAGANVIGCVFNGIPLRQYAYDYGRYDYGEER